MLVCKKKEIFSEIFKDDVETVTLSLRLCDWKSLFECISTYKKNWLIVSVLYKETHLYLQKNKEVI